LTEAKKTDVAYTISKYNQLTKQHAVTIENTKYISPRKRN